MLHRTLTFALLSAAALLLPAGVARSFEWSAQPIVVHEWGVHVFDWSRGRPDPAPLPPSIHTDKNPGVMQPSDGKRVKDLPPDNGARLKPILYFHAPASSLGEKVIGAEVRFAEGHANAWYPQASVYRTPEMVRDAKAPDLTKNEKVPPQFRMYGIEDLRMELVWHRLTLSADVPAGLKLQESLPADHWIRAAREVRSDYVSNGSEVEKFLFYEGATREKPAIALVCEDAGRLTPGSALQIVNIGDKPIHDVFAIYRAGGKTWVGYSSVLAAIKTDPGLAGGSTFASMPLPDFATFNSWIDEKSLGAVTKDRLLAALTEGGNLGAAERLRVPANPQGPTQTATLYPDEAAALEKIWHKDFFEAEGLTILYRESPAALDAAMPLNLYTDMYHYIQLSRCGLVLNSHINVNDATAVFTAMSRYPTFAAPLRDQTFALLKHNRFLTEAAAEYLIRRGEDPKIFADLHNLFDQP